MVQLPISLRQSYGVGAALEALGAALYLALTVRHLCFGHVSAAGFIALLGGAATGARGDDPVAQVASSSTAAACTSNRKG